ncbi:MAG: hypothetical protein WC636_00720 [Candidatus Margulisiibacteriota bacterium]
MLSTFDALSRSVRVVDFPMGRGWGHQRNWDPHLRASYRVVKGVCRPAEDERQARLHLGGSFMVGEGDFSFDPGHLRSGVSDWESGCGELRQSAVVGFLHAVELVEGIDRLRTVVLQELPQFKVPGYDEYSFDLRGFMGDFARRMLPEYETSWQDCCNHALPRMMRMHESPADLVLLDQFLTDWANAFVDEDKVHSSADVFYFGPQGSSLPEILSSRSLLITAPFAAALQKEFADLRILGFTCANNDGSQFAVEGRIGGQIWLNNLLRRVNGVRWARAEIPDNLDRFVWIQNLRINAERGIVEVRLGEGDTELGIAEIPFSNIASLMATRRTLVNFEPYRESGRIFTPGYLRALSHPSHRLCLPSDHVAWQDAAFSWLGNFWDEQGKVVAALLARRADAPINVMTWGTGAKPFEVYQWAARLLQAKIDFRVVCFEAHRRMGARCAAMHKLEIDWDDQDALGEDYARVVREISQGLNEHRFLVHDAPTSELAEALQAQVPGLDIAVIGASLPSIPIPQNIWQKVGFYEGDLLIIDRMMEFLRRESDKPHKFDLISMYKVLFYVSGDEIRDFMFYHAMQMLNPGGLLLLEDWNPRVFPWATDRLPQLVADLSATDCTEQILGPRDESDTVVRIIAALGF